jgi:hypothetical protein
MGSLLSLFPLHLLLTPAPANHFFISGSTEEYDGRPVTSWRVVRDVQRQCPGPGAPAGLPQPARRSLRRSCSCSSQRDRYRARCWEERVFSLKFDAGPRINLVPAAPGP